MRTNWGLAAPVVACLIGIQNGAVAKDGDVEEAEQLIQLINIYREIDKRAYDRAIDALAGTVEGKKRMEECPWKNQSFWSVCLTDEEEWDYAGAFDTLYERYYEEERRQFILPEDSAISREDFDAFREGSI